MMIISASRRTDIPAFYSDWFINRIREGYYFKVNPYNPNQIRGVSLAPEKVDAIVFWSKYPKPLLEKLDELEERGYDYYFQFTLNDYHNVLEPNLPSLEKRLAVFKELSSRIGEKRVIWRYDPIIISTITPIEYHIQTVEELAKELQDYTSKLVISFLDMYGKTKRKLNKVKKKYGIEIRDIVRNKDELIYLSAELNQIANKYNLNIESCGELDNDSTKIIPPGKCVSAELINRVFNKDINVPRDPNQRDTCLCSQSVDMGVYNTCKFACTYCYANRSLNAVKRKVKRHDPEHSVLVGECDKEFVEQKVMF